MRVSLGSSICFIILISGHNARALEPIACAADLQAVLKSTISPHTLNEYSATKTKLSQVTKPEEFLNRSYTLPEALALVERHIELAAPDLAPEIKAWNAELFETHDGTKIKNVENGAFNSAQFKTHLFGKDVAKWPVQLVRNEADLFEVEQNAINMLAQSRFKSIAWHKVVTEGPINYVGKNVETRLQNLSMQYWLGRDQIRERLAAGVFDESFSLFSDLLFGVGKGKSRLNPLHKWIFEKYGMRGLSNYIAAKHGTVASLRYMMNVAKKVVPIAGVVLGAEFYKKIKRMIREQFKTEAPLQVKEEEQKDATQIVKQMNYSPEELQQLNEKAMKKKKSAPSTLDFDRSPATDQPPANDKELEELNRNVMREMDSIRRAKVHK